MQARKAGAELIAFDRPRPEGSWAKRDGTLPTQIYESNARKLTLGLFGCYFCLRICAAAVAFEEAGRIFGNTRRTLQAGSRRRRLKLAGGLMGHKRRRRQSSRGRGQSESDNRGQQADATHV